ncbi:MAG: DUF4422 domain-containing protein [Bacteroides sp.]|nr:DUF4422 domain-containing protein [Bacillota bacterium]MCM1393621.1 DUF4422 domain-containing protein [[Eubacterium] siraeum]MCM1454967.1 DUF4422 domain-containing protein [Bacteroides sp.]
MSKKILVAAHKAYDVPKSKIYLPIQVGAFCKDGIGFIRDDEGDNISSLNANFCELTGAYWAWKNLDADYIGLVHYRRYFAGKERFNVNGKTKKILSERELDALLKKTDVILPKKRHYYIESLYSHYAHTLYVEPLDETGAIIKEFYPKYYAEFERFKTRRSAHIFNMFVMKREIFCGYCEWLFDILFKLKDRVDLSEYSAFHARLFGRISELLLDVYINVNGIKFKEVKPVYIEGVNWFQKGVKFLKAKFKNRKYEK